MQEVLSLYDFELNDIGDKNKRSNLYDLMMKDFIEGVEKVKGQTTQTKSFASKKKKSKAPSKG